ncbi:PRA1 family protein B6 [Hondaea fermentalgiana]|uniref:PRA1 family protein B6 n=1 Tax=Hondaea fermentalgiana TaxID=2315210 RepID=A0A2R5G5R3_9STRA|nr:PRA1 family protein B6 [Hondaea fermentalgiana]|eukprot:GBG26330.1 PRA1 family protein B6 [Hondaea fermentalgiana]
MAIHVALAIAAVVLSFLTHESLAIAGGFGDAVVLSRAFSYKNRFRPAIACDDENDCLVVISQMDNVTDYEALDDAVNGIGKKTLLDGDRTLWYAIRKAGNTTWDPAVPALYDATVQAQKDSRTPNLDFRVQIIPSVSVYGNSSGWVMSWRERQNTTDSSTIIDSIRAAFIPKEKALAGGLWIGEAEGIGIPVNYTGNTDSRTDRNPAVAADVEGRVVLVWESEDPQAVADINLGNDKDLVSVSFTLAGRSEGDPLTQDDITVVETVFPDEETDIFQDRDPVISINPVSGRVVTIATAQIIGQVSDIMLAETSTSECTWKSRVRMTNADSRQSDVMIAPSKTDGDLWLAVWTDRGTGIASAQVRPDSNDDLRVASTSYINPLAFAYYVFKNAKPVLVSDPNKPKHWAIFYSPIVRSTSKSNLVFQVSVDDGVTWSPAYYIEREERKKAVVGVDTTPEGSYVIALFDEAETTFSVFETTSDALYNVTAFNETDMVDIEFRERDADFTCLEIELPRNGSVMDFSDYIVGMVQKLTRCLVLVAPDANEDTVIHMNLEVLLDLEPTEAYQDSCPFNYVALREEEDLHEANPGSFPRRACLASNYTDVQVQADSVYVFMVTSLRGLPGSDKGAIPLALQAWVTPADTEFEDSDSSVLPPWESRTADSLKTLRGHLEDESFVHGEIVVSATELDMRSDSDDLVIRSNTNISIVAAPGMSVAVGNATSFLRVDPEATLWTLDGFHVSARDGKSSGRFGGLFLVLGHVGSIRNCTFTGTTGNNNGGAITVDGRVDEILDCTFDKLVANVGGALGVTLQGEIGLIERCTFTDTYADGFQGVPAGAVLLYGKIETISSSLFQGCWSTAAGGAISVEAGGEITRILDTDFIENSAEIGGGAIEFKQNSTLPAVWRGGVIRGNTANTGAAFHAVGAFPSLLAANSTCSEGNVCFTDVTFEENSAQKGGAVHLDDCEDVSQFSFDNVLFLGNTATHAAGGAILASGSVSLYFVDVTFQDNAAKTSGGALELELGAQVSAAGALFDNNAASTQGGAAFIGAGSVANIASAVFTDNAANLTCREQTICALEAVESTGRRTCGAEEGYQCVLSETPQDYSTIGCTKGVGGSLYLAAGVTAHIHNCSFSAGTPLPNIDPNATYVGESGDTTSYSDGAGRFVYSESRFRLSESTFGGDRSGFAPSTAVIGCPNTCSSTGTCTASSANAPSVSCSCAGAFEGDDGYEEGGCTQLRVRSVRATSTPQVSASFGVDNSNWIASDGFVTISWEWERTEDNLPRDVDYFIVYRTANRSTTLSSSDGWSSCATPKIAAEIVAPCVKVTDISAESLIMGLTLGVSSFFRVVAHVNGQDSADSDAMSSAAIICEEGSSQTPAAADGVFTCEPCDRGTYVQDSTEGCIPCPNELQTTVGVATSIDDCVAPAGFYLEEDEEGNVDVLQCATGVNCSVAGGTLEALELEPGFWRPSLLAETVFECPNMASCIGGTGTLSSESKLRRELSLWSETRYCREGHTGPYCAVCKSGYSKDSNGLCSICTAEKIGREKGLLAGVTLLIGILWPIIIIASYYSALVRTPRRRRGANANQQVPTGFFQKLRLKMRVIFRHSHGTMKKLRGPINITIGLIQVATGFQRVFGPTYNWWSNWDIVTSAFAWANVDSSGVPSVTGCVIEDNHQNRLLFSTILPAGMLLILATLFWVTRCLFARTAEARNDLSSSTWRTAAFLLFLVFPSVNTTIVQTFVCDSFEDGSRTLRFDYATDCDDMGWIWQYAVAMSILYVLAPVALFAALIAKSSKPSVEGASFLHELYYDEEKHGQRQKNRLRRYFEVFELLRKYLLTSVVMLVADGTLAQLAFAFMITFLATISQTMLRPYVRMQDNILATIVHSQLFFVLCAFLMTPVVDDIDALEIAVICVLLVAPVTAAFFIYLRLSESSTIPVRCQSGSTDDASAQDGKAVMGQERESRLGSDSGQTDSLEYDEPAFQAKAKSDGDLEGQVLEERQVPDSNDVGDMDDDVTTVPLAAPVHEGPGDGGVADGPDATASANLRMAQLISLGAGAVTYAKKVNPLQGLNSVADATAKIRSEAKDLVNPTGFSKPQTRSEWMTRISANAKHFRLSYTAMYLLTLVYFVLTSPFLLFEIALVAGLWAFFFKVNKAEDVIKVGKYEIGRNEKTMIFIPLVLFIAFFGGVISTLFSIVFFGTFFTGIHASFRQPIEPDPLDALDGPGLSPPPPQFV